MVAAPLRQHPDVAALQARMADARVRGDHDEMLVVMEQLARIELRDLSPEQRRAQEDYIAKQARLP